YATQTEVNPPTLVLFTNGHDVFSELYQRYLIKCLHDELPYAEIPIRLMWRVKGEQDMPEETQERSAPRRIHGRPEKKAPNKQRALREKQAELEIKKKAVRQTSKPAKWKKAEKDEGGVWRDV